MTYERDLVIFTYRALHPDDLELSEEQIEDFDEALRKRFDAVVRDQAADNDIDTNQPNLSRLVFFSAVSTETAVASKVQEGCEFFLSVYGS